MNKNVQTPKSRAVLVGLCAVTLFLWAVAVYVTYQDAKMARYNVSIKPGAVNYGTHSTVTMPPVMRTSYRHSTPMISGDAVRAYAHTGHATYTVHHTPYTIHTTSSATVHSIGGGGSTGGGMMNGSGSASSARGIRYSGGSVSMPLLAMNSSMMTNPVLATEQSMPRAIGPRRAQPKDPGGDDGEWSDDGAGDGQWYRWDDWAGKWVAPELGDTRIEGGVTYKWDGTSWVPVCDQGDPGVPVGATPWILMLLLAGAYALRLRIKSRKYTNQ